MSHNLAWWVGIVSLMAGTVLGVASADAQESGKKYALLIGVEGYDPAQLTKLEYAEDDVIELGKALEQLGFTVIVMTSKSDIPARRPSTAKKIHDQFDSLLKRVQSEQDMLVVVLSGHGLQYRDDPVDEEGAKETYFCPEEAVPKDRNTLVPISPLSKKLVGSKALKRLLVVDACRNEVAAKGNKAIEETLDAVGRRARTEQRGMLTLFSCAPKEKSWEHPDVGHGVFTNYMLKYLKGEAEPQLYPRDQCSIQQLAAYTSRETSDFVFRRLNQDQSPDLVGRSNDWSFGKRGGSLAKEFTNTLGMKLVLIPAGEFEMGSRLTPKELAAKFSQWGATESYFEDERPPHRVKIAKAFDLGQHEVTVGQFRQFVNNDGYQTEAETDGKGGYGWDDAKATWVQDPKYTWKNPGFTQTDAHPVVNVSWNDAQKFCAWLSRKEGQTYRLPTEGEWEYACKAGSNTLWWNGDDPEATARIGNVADGTLKAKISSLSAISARDGHVFTAPVGQFPANPFGLFDMHGNVNEWCEDVYNAKLYGQRSGITVDKAQTSGSELRVLRGGSWGFVPRFTRSADRFGSTPDDRGDSLGFRLARTR